jgi:hypothetical protein
MSDILEKTVNNNTILTDGAKNGNIYAQGSTAAGQGGVLQPTQSAQFIDYVFDQMVLAQDGRKVLMTANTMELDKIRVGTRLVSKATQADQADVAGFTNKGATFTKLDLTTTKFRLDYELSTESLEDSIEGSSLEDHVVRLMATQFGNDLEDLAINGQSSTGSAYGGTYTNTIDGFVNRVLDPATAGHEAGAASAAMTGIWASGATSTAKFNLDALEAIYNALPRKFKARRQDLKFYMNSKHIQELLTQLRTVNTTDAKSVPYETAQRVLDGQTPRIGGPAGAQYSVFGLPVQEVPLYPEGFVDITFPQNRIWGFQRDVTVHKFFVPKKDSVEYTVYVRLGLALEEKSAIAYGKQV